MRKFILFPAALVSLLFAACSVQPTDKSLPPADIPAYEAQVDADFQAVIASVGTAGASEAFAAFDAKYGTELSVDFADKLAQSRFGGGGSSYPALTDMPFNVDGAVYLSGGSDDLAGSVIGWAAPKSLPGGYFHGAILDLDKRDPNNEDTPCLETAVTKGAGYETENDWRTKINACVLNQAFAIDRARLNASQAALDYYCRPSNIDEAYGFFKNYVDIFNVVAKDDTYWWYCTKVVWAVYHQYGIDVDSNSPQVDFTQSGLYGLVKAYYYARYFYSSSKAKSAINSYIADTRGKIVMAEEIMLSPYMTKVYEAIRE
jgi:hypothetical protein